jgi:hypothetical protein
MKGKVERRKVVYAVKKERKGPPCSIFTTSSSSSPIGWCRSLTSSNLASGSVIASRRGLRLVLPCNLSFCLGDGGFRVSLTWSSVERPLRHPDDPPQSNLVTALGPHPSPLWYRPLPVACLHGLSPRESVPPVLRFRRCGPHILRGLRFFHTSGV